jgi:hypothetical protein
VLPAPKPPYRERGWISATSQRERGELGCPCASDESSSEVVLVARRDLRDSSTHFHSHHFLNNLPGSIHL